MPNSVQRVVDADLVLPPVTVAQVINAYIELHLNLLSPAHRRWSTIRLSHFMKFIGEEKEIKEIKVWHLDLWITAVSNEDQLHSNNRYRKTVKGVTRKASTVNGYGRCIKAFFSWLGSRRYIDADPAHLLTLPAPEETPPRACTAQELARLLATTKADDHHQRGYVIIRLMQATGVRAAGICGLKLKDVDTRERWLMVKEKGRGGNNKARYVPFDPKTAAALTKYIQCQRPHAARYTHVFLAEKRPFRPMTPDSLRQMLKRRSRDANLDRIITPHMIRHYFGTETAVRGGQLRFIQQALGHSDIRTTTIYVRFNPVALRDEYDRIYLPQEDIERPH